MTKAEKLKKIIEIAVERGWGYRRGGLVVELDAMFGAKRLDIEPDLHRYPSLNDIIFSHGFLKAYFGEANLTEEQANLYANRITEKFNINMGDYSEKAKALGEKYPDISWKYHAQQLVLAEDRIEYLWEHRKEVEDD